MKICVNLWQKNFFQEAFEMKRKIKTRNGFTLVELLTTLAVIGVLLGLLIPALNQVGKTAAKVKQKAQFHAIGTALETFRNDWGDYPPSAWDGNADLVPDYGRYCASQRLAEALIGRDGLGFHPASEFREGGLAVINGADTPIYDAINGIPGYQTAAENLAARKGPYLELESANAVKLNQLSLSIIGPLNKNTYVLIDMYKQVKNTATGKDVGLPILYYKANKLRIGNSPAVADWDKINTYSINDSFCNSWGIITSTGDWSDPVANASVFYNAIQNPNFPGPPARPYRAESFLLQSAGPDGLYGTTDDMFNFDQDN